MKKIKKTILLPVIILLLAAGVVFGYTYIDSRLTGNSVGIVRAADEIFNRELAPLPDDIEFLTEDEFLLLLEEEAEELSPEEMRDAIERDFDPNFIEEGFISGSLLDEIAALMIMDPIYEREEISDRIINILFLGDDARIHQSRGRSDTIVLISYNRDTRVIQLTSFMRDTLIPISLTSTYWNRINTMHAVGGPGRLINLMNNLFSLDIQRYAVVRFNGVFMLIDALGGLELYLTEAEAELINSIFPDYDEVFMGYNLLDGRQVLAYSRIRVIDHDLARTQRQRNVLTSLLYRILDTSTVNDILPIAEFALDHVETNFNLWELIGLGLELYSGERPIVEELRIPIDRSYYHARYNGASILVMDFQNNIVALHESIYGTADEVWIPEFTLPHLE